MRKSEEQREKVRSPGLNSITVRSSGVECITERGFCCRLRLGLRLRLRLGLAFAPLPSPFSLLVSVFLLILDSPCATPSSTCHAHDLTIIHKVPQSLNWYMVQSTSIITWPLVPSTVLQPYVPYCGYLSLPLTEVLAT